MGMIHKGKWIKSPWGELVEIDRGIIKLIRLMWQLEIETVFSCENVDGWVHVAVPDIADAARFWAAAHYKQFPFRKELNWHAYCLDQADQALFWMRTQCPAPVPDDDDSDPDPPDLHDLTIHWNGWIDRVCSRFVYCEFPVACLPEVESNLQLALPWEDGRSRVPWPDKERHCSYMSLRRRDEAQHAVP